MSFEFQDKNRLHKPVDPEEGDDLLQELLNSPGEDLVSVYARVMARERSHPEKHDSHEKNPVDWKANTVAAPVVAGQEAAALSSVRERLGMQSGKTQANEDVRGFDARLDFESEEFKALVYELELFEGASDEAKVNILATALGLKPASEFKSYFSDNESTESLLTRLSLYFKEDESTNRYMIANSPENLAKVLASGGIPPKDPIAFGEAMGYPKTAVEAFGHEESLLQKSKYFDKLTEEEEQFLFFRLTKDHYKEELQWLHSIIDAVKKYAPGLYKEVMSTQKY